MDSNMIEVNYEVYYRVGDKNQEPIISYNGIPPVLSRTRRKYAGKKAKIEAIELITGNRLDAQLSTAEVNKYIEKNIFRSPQWKEYLKLFKKFADETEVVVDMLELKYCLKIQMTELRCKPDDVRLLYMIRNELESNRIDEYDGLRNPILSIKQITPCPFST